MGQTMTPSERAAVADRIVDTPAVAAPGVPSHEEIAAGEIAGLIRAADTGALKRTIHGLEHRLGPWVVDPWRLLGVLGDLLARREAPDAVRAGPVPPAGD